MANHLRLNLYFWGLVLSAVLVGSLGVAVVGFGYATQWSLALWHVCQDGLRNLQEHAPVSWQLAILTILLFGSGRGLWRAGRQVRQTRRFARSFLPLQVEPPAQLRRLLPVHDLSATDVIYLEFNAIHAFCMGFWRPRIWLTAGLVDMLADDELSAVLAHEAHHLRRRDPLRLAIGRSIKAAFFFLPLMSALARQAELNQEIDADSAAIAHLNDDLPLLCALRKLLTCPDHRSTLPAVVTAFNVTEARLRRLIAPATAQQPHKLVDWRQWLLNLGVLVALSTVGYLSVQPVIDHSPLEVCTVQEALQPLQRRLPLTEWPFSADR